MDEIYITLRRSLFPFLDQLRLRGLAFRPPKLGDSYYEFLLVPAQPWLPSTCEHTNHKCTVPAALSPCAKREWWQWARFVKHVRSWEQAFRGGSWGSACMAIVQGSRNRRTKKNKKVSTENLGPHCACCRGSPDLAPWTEYPLAAGRCVPEAHLAVWFYLKEVQFARSRSTLWCEPRHGAWGREGNSLPKHTCEQDTKMQVYLMEVREDEKNFKNQWKYKVHCCYTINRTVLRKVIIQQEVVLSIHGSFCRKCNFRGTEIVLENGLNLISIFDRKKEEVKV